jgi:antitoxin CptB
MRELDLLLGGFVDRGYARLDAAEREQFARLLSYPDALLLDYLMGRTLPSDPRIASLVRKIRDDTAAP